MKISEAMKSHLSVSFEVFPPKDDKPIEPLKNTLDKFMVFNPDAISCTYGAGGTNKGKQREILQYICSLGTQAISNYTCIGNTRGDVLGLVRDYMGFGIETFLALRGDYPKGQRETGGDFKYGCELIAFLRERFPALELICGCYPEKHLDAVDMGMEMDVLKAKEDAGADLMISQLCHDLDNLFRYIELARINGIQIPICFGFMPVLSRDATLNMALSNGCSIPKELAEIIGKYGEKPDDFRKAGIEFSIKQLNRVLEFGVDGVHIFALNKFDHVAEIVRASDLRINES